MNVCIAPRITLEHLFDVHQRKSTWEATGPFWGTASMRQLSERPVLCKSMSLKRHVTSLPNLKAKTPDQAYRGFFRRFRDASDLQAALFLLLASSRRASPELNMVEPSLNGIAQQALVLDEVVCSHCSLPGELATRQRGLSSPGRPRTRLLHTDEVLVLPLVGRSCNAEVKG